MAQAGRGSLEVCLLQRLELSGGSHHRVSSIGGQVLGTGLGDPPLALSQLAGPPATELQPGVVAVQEAAEETEHCTSHQGSAGPSLSSGRGG